MSLTKAVANSLGCTEDEAREEIVAQANMVKDNGDMDYETVEEALYDLGVEPDYMMEFMEFLI